MKEIYKKISFTDIILLFTLLFNGGFNEYISCIISISISIYLFYHIIKSKTLNIKLDLFSFSIFLICFMYGFSTIWAIDSGMSFIGFLKFLPISLYLLAIQQDKESNIIDILPLFASILVVISLIGMHISFAENYFSVAGRLAGFFQYPNTFAIFLVVCELLLISKQRFKIIDYIYLIILIIGLLYTGSRTASIVALCSNIALIVFKFKNSQNKKYYLLLFSVLVVSIVVVLIFNKDILNRYMSISVLESTFIGRILYWIDALPLLIKYPFGMGYLGYSYIQASIQTGVYTVKYIHNDFLQLFLDIGLIPAIIFIVAIIHILFKKDVHFSKKIIISSICLHSFFDFNLQFIAVFLLLILLCNEKSEKVIVINKKLGLTYCILATIILINIYMGIHLLLSEFHKNDIAQKLYPFNTENMISILETEDNLQLANDISDKIINQNKFTYIPYSMKSKYYYSIGDINNLINCKHKVFEKNPFEYSEYDEYCSPLFVHNNQIIVDPWASGQLITFFPPPIHYKHDIEQ